MTSLLIDCLNTVEGHDPEKVSAIQGFGRIVALATSSNMTPSMFHEGPWHFATIAWLDIVWARWSLMSSDVQEAIIAALASLSLADTEHALETAWLGIMHLPPSEARRLIDAMRTHHGSLPAEIEESIDRWLAAGL